MGDRQDQSSPFMWPWLAAASFGQTAAAIVDEFAKFADAGDPPSLSEPSWATPNRVVLDLPTVRLREFVGENRGAGPSRPTIVVAPLAVHHATVADFAPGHSVVEALLAAGLDRVLVTEWKSATPEMRFAGIDAYLADLNVIADDAGAAANLVGICQGGWLALIFATRFQRKVRSLVIAGAPVDTRAAPSALTQLVDSIPSTVFDELVIRGSGRVIGDHVLRFWRAAAPDEKTARDTLQIGTTDRRCGILVQQFLAWYAYAIDLPGTYYLQVVEQIYRQNRIAAGTFMALGRLANLAILHAPIFVLAGETDQIVAPEQALAVRRLVGTKSQAIEIMMEPCGHLSLFMGAQALTHAWPRIGRWLSSAAA